MAIPSRQIGWGTEDNLLWQISKQLERLTCVTAGGCGSITTTTTTTLPPYKVYTALLNQDSLGDIIVVSTLENTLGVVDSISGTFGNIVIAFVDPVIIENQMIGFTYSGGEPDTKYYGWVVAYQSPTNVLLISSGVAGGEQQKEIRVDIRVYN